tara:strand:+ start:246 stop:911 length:666 start_codon:yes stop_codon:yes gene_type:complete
LIDIEKIQQAISELNKVSVKGGGKYTMVAPRVETFRKFVGADLGIDTEVLCDNETRVVIKALIKDKSGFVVASGLAEELRGSSSVNRSAALENCETSAVGRAMASLGLHGGEYASVEEIDKAHRNSAVRDQREQQGQQGQQPSTQAPGLDEPPIENADEWRIWVNQEKRKIEYFDQKYQLTKWGKDTKGEREALAEYDREMTAELKDFYATKYETLNTGVR